MSSDIVGSNIGAQLKPPLTQEDYDEMFMEQMFEQMMMDQLAEFLKDVKEV